MTRSGWILVLLAAPLAAGCDRPLWDEAEDDEPSARRAPPPPAIPQIAFADAVRVADAEEQDAPRRKLRAEFERRWNEVRFVSPSGHAVQYRAVVDTPFGAFVAELRPDWAPNHVRCFVSLARAGSFDGALLRHLDPDAAQPGGIRTLAPPDSPPARRRHGGFRLKPEIHPDARHFAGAVGMESSPEGDTLPERFYITVSAVPQRDGADTVFGHVTHGLETVRRISWALGHDPREQEPFAEIRSVTIQAREVAAW